MRIWESASRVLLFPFRRPSLLLLSVVYSGLLYAAVLRAGILDVANPYWVLSVGALLLLSPIYHALLLPAIERALRGAPADWRSALRAWHVSFPRLFVGELVVGAAVVVGGLLFLIPGIYAGMRLIYYKQSIVLDREPIGAALRASAQATADQRSTVGLFFRLAALYGCILGLDTLFIAYAPDAAVHVGSVLGSALLLVWMNVLVTTSYVRSRDEAELERSRATDRR